MPGSPTPDTSDLRKSRYRDIFNGVFGLILALGAFSVTNVSVRDAGDVWNALRLFVPSFFFVLAIWSAAAELFDRYPSDDGPFYGLVIGVMFLTTLAPVFLNLLLNESTEVQMLGARLFPISMAATFGLLLVLWIRLMNLERVSGGLSDSSSRVGVVISATMVVIFMGSLTVPFASSNGAPRALVWFAAFPAPHVTTWVFRRWLRQ